jgi:hypothetical protein
VTEKETEKTGMSGSGRTPTPKSQKGKGTQWSHLGPALKGIDQKEIDTHKKGNDNGCWCCGDHNHRTVDCYASKTLKAGTELPRPNMSSTSLVTKRKREEEPEEDEGALVPFKQQKVATITTNDDDMREAPIWAEQSDSGEDFQ